MPRNDLILVLDCEMTGNTDRDELTEVGVVALQYPDWQEIDSFSRVIQPTAGAMDHLRENPKVSEMLTSNGLVKDIEDGLGLPPDAVDAQLVEWLDSKTDKKHRKTHVPYGGSGVTWFDRKYIAKFLPRFNDRITYRAFDTSVLRSTFALAGVPWTSAYESKTHRALDDARAHAEELRYVVESLRTWYGAYTTPQDE